MSMRLSENLFNALEARLNLVSLGTLKSGYRELSRAYRGRTVSEERREDLSAAAPAPAGGRAPGGYTRAQARAFGYMAARFPATFAAVAEALSQVPDEAFKNCHSVMDLGAGPGTATWALQGRWPALISARLLEANPEMLGHAQALSAVFPGLKVTFHSGDLAEQVKLSAPSDLVVMAYVLSEMDESLQDSLLEAAWEKARCGLFLLEPGTPETSRRVLAARALWVRLGGRLIAPCPQAGTCPMETAGRPPTGQAGPAWCHFSVRLERRGLHKAVKGGDLGYEDEKYSWIFVSKNPDLAPAAPFRLHSDPHRVNRNITLDVCDAKGKRRQLFYKRRETHAAVRLAARQRKWGDGWDPDGVDLGADTGEEGLQD